MLERESGYFLQALCRDLLQLPIADQEVEHEFAVLADRAQQADATFFMHRDFQSRNIMVLEGRVRFIDFQGGRLGPAAYDLASLLIDPYAALPQQLQSDLLELYLDEFTTLVSYDRQRFKEEYLVLALQRNLQMLGAFAFLSNQRGKPFFRQYIKPALCNLQTLLAKADPDEYPSLKALTEQCLAEIDKR
jgi:aminoglycoside/choline kinase family phosphotransferase